MSDPVAIVGGLFCVACVWIALRALDAISHVEVQFRPGQTTEELKEFAKETQKWLEIADKTNGIKAAVFGVLGVFFGVVGGLFADWVAHGTWSETETFRAVGVLVLLVVATSCLFYGIERLKVIPRIIERRRKRAARLIKSTKGT